MKTIIGSIVRIIVCALCVFGAFLFLNHGRYKTSLHPDWNLVIACGVLLVLLCFRSFRSYIIYNKPILVKHEVRMSLGLGIPPELKKEFNEFLAKKKEEMVKNGSEQPKEEEKT